ncbi:MAG: (Fe-S)-binding protein [Chloroflexi bacterium]|nr:(Fe-S)-binding protein [Chloroflexota bacterium]
MKWDGSEFKASLSELAEFGLDNCIGVNDCMKKCPVNRLKVNQNELDSVFVSGEWTERVETFVTECIQCGDCTLACPAGVHRDHMMLMLKTMLPTIPKQWEKYYAVRGRRDRSWLISLYDMVIRIAAGPMGKHIDKARLEQKPLLFYFGCYAFSPSGSPAATLKLADRLDLDYEVLGGVRSCCGWPQYLSGRMGYGQQMLIHLGTLIDQVQPEAIVSACAECYTALLRLKKKTGASWIPLTTPEWLLGYADKLTWQKFDYPIAVHDSCHVTKKVGKPQPIRELLSLMAEVVEIAETPQTCICCGYYNIHANDELNHQLHEEKLQLVREKGADGMAVECVTCWESFHPPFKQAEVPLLELMAAAEQATRQEVNNG